MTLVVEVRGAGHLAQTLRLAFEMKGFVTGKLPDIVFVAPDILDHSSVEQVEAAHRVFQSTVASGLAWQIIVVVSQVPPGTIRKWVEGCSFYHIFYQVDTLIVNKALERALNPEQIVIGAHAPKRALPLQYQQFLRAFNCPVIVTDYESAELAKCAINYALASQIRLANRLSAIARWLGANYDDVEKVLRNDARIGPQAYLKPGELNQHLLRDVLTLQSVRASPPKSGAGRQGGLARAAALTPERRREIARMGVAARWGKLPVV